MSFYNGIEIEPRSSYYGLTGSVIGKICNFGRNEDIQYGARQFNISSAIFNLSQALAKHNQIFISRQC